jgi:cobalamin biosynthesis Mg chelatase CobN
MNAEVLNARALTMRVGAVLAAFVLAFSLLLLAPPAHASMLGWHNTRFSGDEVIFTSRTRMSESEGGDGATADICTEAQKNVGTTVWGWTTTRAYLDHYQGMQVCAVESKATLEAMLNGTARSELFGVLREGEKIKVKGVAPHDTVQYSDTYSFTFDGGITTATSANVVGNTATVFGNKGLYDATFEVVGSTKASASAKPSSSGAASPLNSSKSGIPAATSSPSVAASDAIKPQETTSNAAAVAAGAGATSSAGTSSAVGTAGSNDTIIYGAVVVVGALALGGLGVAVWQSRKKI